MEAIRWVGFVAGLGVVVGSAGSVLRALVVPRGQNSRLTFIVGQQIVWRSFLAIANRYEDYEHKDRILARAAPTGLVAVLLAWLGMFLFGYALLLWPMVEGGFPAALVQSGSSMLTLGFATSGTPTTTVIDFFAAITGLVVVALQIAYLPTLYAAFNRRETLVTLLQSRAGAPAWGPEILRRSTFVDLESELPFFYGAWEQWAADVAESHTTYPILVWFRSPHPLRSWVVALLAVLDSAALYQALCPERAPAQTRLCLRMGFTCLRYIAQSLRIPFDPDPFPDEPIDLTYDEFLGAVHPLQEAGFQMERTPEEAWEHFRGWRVNYESLAYAIADRVVAPPGPWSGPRHHLPGLAIVPERPPDRRPGDHKDHDPKSSRFGWRA